jgi:hypothetical protein
MLNVRYTQKRRNETTKYKSLAALMLTTLISSCGDNDSTSPETKVKESKVNFMLASVEGGACSLHDPYSNMTTLAGPVTTNEGVGIFEDIDPSTGLTLVECSGGTYVDEATGETMTPGILRAYINITSSEFTATVTPLTEIAVRIVENYDLTPEEYATVSENVAYSFGLKNVDLATVVPLDLNVYYMDGSDEGNYGLVLAALSQLQNDYEEGTTADAVIEELYYDMANNGLFTTDRVRDYYFEALENMFDNPRIDPYLGSDEDLDIFFNGVVLAPFASQVEYVDADHPDSNDLEALTVIDAYETSKFDIVGTSLSMKMNVTLAGEACLTQGLQTLSDTNAETSYNLMYAECPAQAVGEADLVIMDHGRLENTTTMTVVEPGTWDYGTSAVKKMTTVSRSASNNVSRAVPTGTSYVFGYVAAETPAINDSVSAAHDYSSANITQFNVKGTTVELINESKEVIATTITDDDGYYQFDNAPESTSVSVVVKAEIKKARASDNTGPEYNFAVRDNTSTTNPRKMYQVSTPYFTTLAEGGADNTQQDIVAKVGFNDNGDVVSEDQRESAPFAILRTMKSGADELEKINPNISMPELNIYWSGKNIGSSGDKKLGQIGTSHYSSQGLLPGLYILGKADSDTDEFDQGVIGHEFGHFLQDQLSYSDSPGGDHGDNEYKDASLAYGEGYGTAIGGLLSGSQYYCDVSGSQQSGGFCWDLKNKNLDSDLVGFYSESSIVTLMYGIGTLPGKGISEFFDSVTKIKSGMHSATIYPFLNYYLESNPDVASEVATLMAEHNIKTSDPFGKMPEGTALDLAIAASANQNNAAVGADDLEQLYIDLTLESVNSPLEGEAPALLTPNSTTFCVNRNLPGANSWNGLGMTRRLTFTANYTGDMLVRAVNKLGQTVSDQDGKFKLRNEDGKNQIDYGYSGVNSDDYYGIYEIVSGKKYSLNFAMENPEAILNGSQCGYKVELARPAG